MKVDISPWQFTYTKIVALFGKEWDPKSYDEEPKSSYSARLSGPRKKAHSFLLKASSSSLLDDEREASTLQNNVHPPP